MAKPLKDADLSNIPLTELLQASGAMTCPLDEMSRFLNSTGNNDFNRLRMRATYESGIENWAIGERFCDRYETEVGGRLLNVTQGIDENGQLVGGLTVGFSLKQLGKHPSSPRPPQIVDYQTNTRYTLEQARDVPELNAVAKRLAERIAEYDFRRRNKESWQFAKRYKIERDSCNGFNLLHFTRESRKLGFPIVNNLSSGPMEEQLAGAARLLLNAVDIRIELPERFAVLPGTALHDDAVEFLSLTNANTEQAR